ncbi:hypothetical protein [Albirhodobacter sp. R86504]|uniref:hypothetical protein n=1 Tax=Albirhodobacter sp. R86504 TaxID=3093848 RepID=UPI00366CA777
MILFALDPITVEQRDDFVGPADRATTTYVSDDALERARTGDLTDVLEGAVLVLVEAAFPQAQGTVQPDDAGAVGIDLPPAKSLTLV